MDDAAVEPDIETRIEHAFFVQPFAGAEIVHQIDGALLQHAGADAALDVIAAVRFQHDTVDAGALQQQRQEQPGRTRADDSDLRAHSRSAYSQCCAPWKTAMIFNSLLPLSTS
jgi:hypothetical protein